MFWNALQSGNFGVTLNRTRALGELPDWSLYGPHRALIVIAALIFAATWGTPSFSWAQDAAIETENERALAVYADAANFQTAGELQLAIEQWQKFLSEFAEDPLAPKAAHYLGVCLMQLAEPKYAEASAAFERALKNEKYDLREESLSNLGWCQYAVGVQAGEIKADSLRNAIKTFGTLMEEFPSTNFADRALFYTGEAQYNLGEPARALAAYDRLLGSRDADKSALRCDALYAKGVALEDLKRYDDAVGTYRTMLNQCGEDPLAAAVKMRLAEVLILQGKFADAEPIFAQVIENGDPQDRPRALYRRAFVLAQLNRGEEAAALYEQLLQKYPDSPYAASAQLAAAQSLYRAGKLDDAAERFRAVIGGQADQASATEAAHWLATIAIGRGQVEEAERVARQQIEKGVAGPYAMALRLDAAEALSYRTGGQEQALQEFETLSKLPDNDVLLPRILYNAAFTALQLGQADKVPGYVDRFTAKFATDPLAVDMLYLRGEALLRAGRPAEADQAYDTLLKQAPENHPQLALWTLRSATAKLAAGNAEGTISLLVNAAKRFTDGASRAESQFLIGNAHLSLERPAEAVKAYGLALEADPNWRRRDELLFRLAAAELAAGDVAAAQRDWERVITENSGSPLADQARYRLAQLAADLGDVDRAIRYYEQLQGDATEPAMRPFALYGLGWSRLQAKQYEAAIAPLTAFIDQFPDHGLRDDCMLARGMCYRRQGNLPAAQNDLQAFLDMSPTGTNLGHGLYELALVYRQQDKPAEAAAQLQRLVADVPDYPSLAEVWYELAWSRKEAGMAEGAVAAFVELVKQFPDSAHVAEASFYVGQAAYAAKDWDRAERAYSMAAEKTAEVELLEKTLYRLGWSRFQSGKFDPAVEAFALQAEKCPDGSMIVDALMMLGECQFSKADYQAALIAYQVARDKIQAVDGDNKKFADTAEQQVRELVYLHGGQSAAQLKKWDDALQWYEQLRSRYPSSAYLPQVFYETGFAYQQMDKTAEAIKFYEETANNFHDESAARARFMLGELQFQQNNPTEAIKEFKRVMYGFGAEQAAESIKDWQAKSGFEAGRCAELLVQSNQGDRRREAIELALRYYEYVTELHATHALAAKARDRIDVLKRL